MMKRRIRGSWLVTLTETGHDGDWMVNFWGRFRELKPWPDCDGDGRDGSFREGHCEIVRRSASYAGESDWECLMV